MPLRDHFHSPLDDKHAWNEFHAMWPATIVQQLFRILPTGFIAAPSVYLSKDYEIDIGVLDDDRGPVGTGAETGGLATAVAPHPTLTLDTELTEEDEFEVRIYDTRYERDLVAAIELVSPRNKDRWESRRAFIGKVASLLQRGICVSIVDLVTNRRFSLYSELLKYLGRNDPTFGPTPPHLYAVTLRGRRLESRMPARGRTLLDLWHYPMEIGQPMPTLPIWLETEMRVLLPLETSYEDTCKFLHIR